MSKLTVGKNEGVAEVVERILAEEAGEAVLVIPKGAELGGSAANFYLLKREADLGGKSVLVESVDENVLALAKAAGIGASHPLFEGTHRAHSFSDIKPQQAERVTEKPRGRRKKAEEPLRRVGVEYSSADAGGSLRVRSEELEEPSKQQFLDEEPQHEEEEGRWAKGPAKNRWISRKLLFRAGAVLAVLVLAFWFFGGIFSRAVVEIDFEETPWIREGQFVADVSVSRADPVRGLLPAELFSLDRNLTQLFAASGMSEVSEKATGKIWIYNAFNSSPQTLVATTRFEAPDGKIFRITDRVTVPGAVIKDGKIIPSSIEADIVADKPGPEYNLEPIPRLSIPGFKNSARFDGFYGEIRKPTSGGFIGKKAVPIASDIQKARERTTEILRTSLEAEFVSSYPEGFAILKEASVIDIRKLTVDENTDEKGQFSVFGEATMRALGFREADLRAALLSLLQKELPEADFKELTLNYANVRPNFDGKKLSFTLGAEAETRPGFSIEDFKAEILGKKIGEVRSMVAGLEGLSRGRVSIWPFWVNRVPKNLSKVKVEVN